MSIVTHNRAIAPTLWPGDLGRVNTSSIDLQVKDDWRYVPDNFEGICDWATVTKEEDDRGDFTPGHWRLVYVREMLPEDMRSSVFQVTVVLQGFLGDFNISVLGNWKRKDKSPHTAVQFLNLESGGVSEAFSAQVRALQNIRALISAKAGAELGDRADESTSITFRRRVFTKVRPYGNEVAAIRLSNVTDPGGYARKISSQWRVDHIIKTGARRANGENMEIAHSALRRGDFVEVSAYADLNIIRRNRKTGTVINFAMEEVVRLWSAEESKVHFARTDVPGGERSSSCQVKIRAMPSGFRIGGMPEEAMELA
ncbi:hypothetical protein ACG7TL_005132 [Trametes sanguinea]